MKKAHARVRTSRRHYSDDELISHLTGFCDIHRRPPTIADFSDKAYVPHPQTYARRYGSWNKALAAAHLHPMQLMFGPIPAPDSHLCRSALEFDYDFLFHRNHVEHEREKRYPGQHMTCDFFLPQHELWIETVDFDGSLLTKNRRQYAERLDQKIGSAKEHSLALVLFGRTTLDKLYDIECTAYSPGIEACLQKIRAATTIIYP